MAKFDVVTIGGAVRDITFYTAQGKIIPTPQDLTAQKMLAFEYGAKVRVSEAHYHIGGGAANSAAALSRLKFKVATITRLGKDQDANDIYYRFKEQKVNTDYLQLDGTAHTGVSFILAMDKKDRDHIAFVYRGSNDYLTFSSPKLSKLKATWFYLTSLSGEHWQRTLRQIFRFAKQQPGGIKIAWNPGIAQLQAGKRVLAPFLKQTDLLIVNKDEAIELVLSGVHVGRKDPSFLNRPVYLLNILKDWGVKLTLVTAGEQGSWAYDGKQINHQKIIKTKVVDTTGVGDAFGSSFLAGLIKTDGNITAALLWGSINAAAVCREVGAQNGLLTLAEIEKKVSRK